MKTLSLIALVLAASIPFGLAQEKPAAPPAAPVETTAVKSPEARIAELEARVAVLEKALETLRTAAVPSAAASTAPRPATSSGADQGARYQKLSEPAREKLRAELRTHTEAMKNLTTPEDRRTFLDRLFDKIEAEDSAGKLK